MHKCMPMGKATCVLLNIALLEWVRGWERIKTGGKDKQSTAINNSQSVAQTAGGDIS